jgi:hydrogenase-4 component F
MHVINNALTKGVLFFSAGNIHRAFASKKIDDVHGAMAILPLSSMLLLVGFLAGCGSPPFGPFISEFTIFTATFAAGRWVVGSLFLVLLMIVFVGMGITVLSVVMGKPSQAPNETVFRDSLSTGGPAALCLALVFLLGIYMPESLRTLIVDGADFLEPPKAVAQAEPNATPIAKLERP